METRSLRVETLLVRAASILCLYIHTFFGLVENFCAGGVQIAFRPVPSGRRPFVTADSGQATYKPATLIMTPRRLTTSSSYAHSWSNIHAFTRSSSSFIPLCHRFPNGISLCTRTVVFVVTWAAPIYIYIYTGSRLFNPHPLSLRASKPNNERYRVNAKLIHSNYPLSEVRPK